MKPRTSNEPSQPNRAERYADLIPLIDAAAYDAADAASVAALEARLLGDAGAQRFYLDYAAVHQNLAWQGERPARVAAVTNWELGTRNSEVAAGHASPVRRSAFGVRRSLHALAAALVVAGAAVAIYVYAMASDSGPLDAESVAVATVLDTTDGSTLIVNDEIAFPGQSIRTGRVSLDGGAAEFRLANGVGVRLIGATQLVIHDDMRATLTQGTASFDCPHGVAGYAVRLADGTRVVDLGTRFAVEADPVTHAARVCVYEGVVELTRGDDRWRLTAGDGWSVVEAQTPATFKLDPIELAVGPLSPTARAMLGRNLIVNGDAEAEAGPADNADRTITGWDDDDFVTFVPYGTPGGFPTDADPGAPLDQRGRNLFSGGRTEVIGRSSISQTIALDELADVIDNGYARLTLAGYLGGYLDQNDTIALSATALDRIGRPLGEPVTIGPVTRFERGDRTGMLLRTADASVPPGARSIRLVLEARREIEGGAADGYADNLSLTLSLNDSDPGVGAD